MNSLTRADLKSLIALCDSELGHAGINTPAGRAAADLADKLTLCLITFPRGGAGNQTNARRPAPPRGAATKGK